MIFTYIFHSGFIVETNECILIFDAWIDPAHVVSKALLKQKPTYVFASHHHEDHFSREILSWKSLFPHTPFTIILSKDILEHHCADATDADIWLKKGMHWSDRRLSVYATGSNDSGVSWIVETAGKRIFHAGDLNNWYARFLNETYQNKDILTEEFEYVNPQQEENRFLEELNDIEKITKQFDVVMFPVDGRIGNGYTKGARQFLDHFDVGTLIPMHFAGSSFESAWRMNEFAQEKGVDFWCIKYEGETKEIF